MCLLLCLKHLLAQECSEPLQLLYSPDEWLMTPHIQPVRLASVTACKEAAMMCRQDTVKVMSLPRLPWQSAFWTDLLQSSTYRLTS